MNAKRSSEFVVLAAIVSGAVCLAVPGPFFGDVPATLALQAIFGPSPTWAQWLTDTAKPPLVMATLILGAALAWLAAGLRGAIAVPIAFGLGWLIDQALRAIIFMPRPAPELVAVTGANASSGLPSTFGLVYGSIFGAVLFVEPKGKVLPAARVLAIAMIISGAAARVVLGGHWPTQMFVSIMLGLAAAASAVAMTDLSGRDRLD